jgi:hypothetical protein
MDDLQLLQFQDPMIMNTRRLQVMLQKKTNTSKLRFNKILTKSNFLGYLALHVNLVKLYVVYTMLS